MPALLDLAENRRAPQPDEANPPGERTITRPATTGASKGPVAWTSTPSMPSAPRIVSRSRSRGPIPTASAYSTSKGAVSALTKSIACEIDRGRYPDVLVNEFLPGVIRTRMTPDQGDDPMDVYPRTKSVVALPAGGPHGRIFIMG